MQIAQRIEVRGTYTKDKRKTKIPASRLLWPKIRDEFAYKINLEHYNVIKDFISALDCLLLSIYPTNGYTKDPTNYCVAVSPGLDLPCELWYIQIDNNGYPQLLSCDTCAPTVKNIHQKIFHQQFFHVYTLGRALTLPPLYMYGNRKVTEDIQLTVPTQLKEFLSLEN